jgi:hypothetical protein
MGTFLMILVVISMLATLGVMFAGMLGMARSAEGTGGARSNTLMRWRIGLQALTVVLFLLLLAVR